MQTETATAPVTPKAPPGAQEINGKLYMEDGRGQLLPIETIKPQDLLGDEVVRKICGYAQPLAAELARFKQHSFDDVDGFLGLLAQQYGVKLRGKKGNHSLTTIDGLKMVQVAVSESIDFGPELQIAKAIVDECLRDWSAEASAEIRAIITRAFNVDNEGKINRNEMLSLLRIEFSDERWQRAMAAVRDSMRVTGSKRYLRVYERDQPDGEWKAVVLTLAAA